MNYERDREVGHATLTRQNAVPDVVSCMPAAGGPGGLARLGESAGTGGTAPPPGPINFISWEGLRAADISKIGPILTDIVLFFRQFAIFAYTLWALWRLGPFSVMALKAWSPRLGSHFSRPGLGQVYPSAFQ